MYVAVKLAKIIFILVDLTKMLKRPTLMLLAFWPYLLLKLDALFFFFYGDYFFFGEDL